MKKYIKNIVCILGAAMIFNYADCMFIEDEFNDGLNYSNPSPGYHFNSGIFNSPTHVDSVISPTHVDSGIFNSPGYGDFGTYNSPTHVDSVIYNSPTHVNSGTYNSGIFNSGTYNSGTYNSGIFNSGIFNSPTQVNSGTYNSGTFNSPTQVNSGMSSSPGYVDPWMFSSQTHVNHWMSSSQTHVDSQMFNSPVYNCNNLDFILDNSSSSSSSSSSSITPAYIDKIIQESALLKELKDSVTNLFGVSIASMLVMRKNTTLAALHKNLDFTCTSRIFAMCGKVLIYSSPGPKNFIKREVTNYNEVPFEILECLQDSTTIRNLGKQQAGLFLYLNEHPEDQNDVIDSWTTYLKRLNCLMLKITNISSCGNIFGTKDVKLHTATGGTFTLYTPNMFSEKFSETAALNKALHDKDNYVLNNLREAMIARYNSMNYSLNSDVYMRGQVGTWKNNNNAVVLANSSNDEYDEYDDQ